MERMKMDRGGADGTRGAEQQQHEGQNDFESTMWPGRTTRRRRAWEATVPIAASVSHGCVKH
eukprot:6125990-Pleurochrysis_carterae.AAC.2